MEKKNKESLGWVRELKDALLITTNRESTAIIATIVCLILVGILYIIVIK